MDSDADEHYRNLPFVGVLKPNSHPRHPCVLRPIASTRITTERRLGP